VYADYSDQLFDHKAANPYTPSLEIWPSTMPLKHQNYLSSELQRLFTLLNCHTGIYNIESRVCKDGKAYIMEVSPRAGGNRIAELQRIGTGVDLIDAEICKAVGLPIPQITFPEYEGYYVNDIIHSNREGRFSMIEYDEVFKHEHFISEAIYPAKGDFVELFHGANNAVGSVFLRFDSRNEIEQHVLKHDDNIQVIVE
jgi:biotin carboxylase